MKIYGKIIILTLFILILVFLFSAIFLNKESKENLQNTKATPTPKIETSLLPEQTAINFYDWYLKYNGNPLTDNSYKKSEYLTDVLKIKIEKQLVSYKESGYDFMLCAKNKPSEVTVHLATISSNLVTLTVTEVYSGKKFDHKVVLTPAGSLYKISDIICTP